MARTSKSLCYGEPVLAWCALSRSRQGEGRLSHSTPSDLTSFPSNSIEFFEYYPSLSEKVIFCKELALRKNYFKTFCMSWLTFSATEQVPEL